MQYSSRMLLIPLCSIALAAFDDPAWRTKPVAEWTADDARQVLESSPWVKVKHAAPIAVRSEDQLRAGGKTGTSTGANRRPNQPGSAGFTIRWESAAPVRAAELLAHEAAPPDWDGDYYVIAIYDVPGLSIADRKELIAEQRRTALLRCGARRVLKPVRVDIVPGDRLARVVYFFAKSHPISLEDSRIEFVAQLGGISLDQSFLTEEMRLQGKLEL